MSRYRKGAGGKRDENEPDIIKALRAHGCVVMQLSGKGIPDLLVLRNGTKWLADVKMPGKPTTEAQEELWEEAATKARCSVFILRTPEDAQKMLNNALQPWEPVMPKARANDVTAHERRPRKGDAAKAPHQLDALAKRLGAGYIPPRSKPVDAAKEAEATFAPADDGHQPCAHSGCTKRVIGSDTCMEHDPEPAWALPTALANPCTCRLGVLCSFHKARP